MHRSFSIFYSPYLRRLESLTICRCNYKGSTFSLVILRPLILVRPASWMAARCWNFLSRNRAPALKCRTKCFRHHKPCQWSLADWILDLYFKQVKIVLYENDKSVQKDLLFNAKSADEATWFWRTKLLHSSWSDIENTRFTDADSKSLFSIRDRWSGINFFFISKKEHVECESKEGWLRVLEEGEGCANTLKRDTSGIYYSKKTTATLWSKGTNGPLKRQKNWAWTCGKCCTDRIILPVYRDNNFLRVEKKWAKDQVAQGCVNTTPLKIFENQNN